MPNPQLKKSPILEAVCEFRFAPESEWDWTIPGRLAEALKGSYPTRKEVLPQVLRFGDDPGGLDPVPPERIQLYAADGLSLVQTGPRLLTVNRLAPYPGWESFVDAVRGLVKEYEAMCGWGPLARVGLLYINRIETDQAPHHVLTIGPDAGVLPQGVNLGSFAHRWDCAFGDSGLVLLTTRSTDPAGIVIQTDASTSAANPVHDQVSAFAWLEEAHARTYEVFRSVLTDEAWRRLEEAT
jgi:uncharacterized protein (TIGR04255 family)